MICEFAPDSFFVTWALLTAVGLGSVVAMSAAVFYRYYVNPRYEDWRFKTQTKYPDPEKVRLEIIQTVKGIFTGTFCPAVAVFLARNKIGNAYCGVNEEYGWGYLVASFFVCWIAADFWEFYYHHLGHKYTFMWEQHRHHHVFHNPSPFAVIADEYVDQFVRAFPLVLFPLIAPVNMDMLFFQFAVFFYAYGCYLHWGFEASWPDAHHPWINTAYQHNLHHNKSIMNKPLHTGFMFKLWDQAFGTVYKGKCDCVKCQQEAGLRTREQFEKVEKPDYGVLLNPSFWSSELKCGALSLAPKVAIGAPLIWGMCFVLQSQTVQGVEL